ncbi:MAG: PEP-CTERM sorting domain-containing protein [Symploca sp. SIO3C6]|uniref:PEP-CTERM sorting domain-containing protein n=1 Tax=Symploca sp. SIO1C4 TaxID=2607765 RepID=A0A6B3NBX8_9CYAN|nr:PEP-CTERM sorting domain-containing protein [Symploca sp. SIO3C6]NER26678.1 PEP-CTERM sorting domain-containing protein [Symploca sp. SIO1C4]NET07601.1 PEP-CTERM sorting domain-containing protein [Symploca sp. SIO2B6]
MLKPKSLIFNKLQTLVVAGAGILLGLGVIETNSAQAALINGSFEQGFKGFSTIGDASIKTAAFGSGPTDGNKQALLTNGFGSVSDANLEKFLELNAGILDTIGIGDATGGSALQQTFTANAGDVLSFKFNFLTNEFTPEFEFNDFAFVSLTGIDTLADTFSDFVSTITPFDAETGFGTFSQTISVSGTYSLGIGIVDLEDKIVDSGLLVDNIKLKSVPEPITILGSLAALGFGAMFRRTRQNSKMKSNFSRG